MESHSIATTSLSLLRWSTKTNASLKSLKFKKANPILIALSSAIVSLTQILRNIHECFDVPLLGASALATQTEVEHWRNAQEAMKECEEILKNLDGKLEEVIKSYKGMSGFLMKYVHLHPTETSLVQLQVETYCQAMKLSLHIMIA